MQLALTHPCSWMGLLLLVSSLLLWEHVTSTSDDQMTNEELYYKLLSISHHTRIVSRQMYKILDKKLAKGRLFRDSRNNTCHTTSISASKKTDYKHNIMTLKSDMAVKQDSGNDHKLGMSYFIVIPTDVGIKSSAESYSFFAGHNDKYVAVPETKDLLKVIINVSSTWKYPLKLLPPATLTHLGSYDGMLARAIEVNFGNQEVLKGAKILLSRIQPGFEENDYTNWPELKQLRSSNEDTHLLAFYKLFYCLHQDTKKVDRYLKSLRCRVIKNYKC